MISSDLALRIESPQYEYASENKDNHNKDSVNTENDEINVEDNMEDNAEVKKHLIFHSSMQELLSLLQQTFKTMQAVLRTDHAARRIIPKVDSQKDTKKPQFMKKMWGDAASIHATNTTGTYSFILFLLM